MRQDSVDRHIEHWQREIPDLDPLVEGVVTRMQMVLRHLKQTRQALLAAHGLEEYEYATLHFLGGRGPGHRATPSDIAAWHQMSPPASPAGSTRWRSGASSGVSPPRPTGGRSSWN